MTTTPAHLTAELDNPFWRFSLSVYQHEAVKTACLSLQDTYHVNVNLLLLCCWLAYSVEKIDKADLAKASKKVSNWQQEVSQGLRKTRRWLQALGDKEPWIGEFAQQVLVQEIVSETYQQHLLFLAFKNKQKTVPAINEALALDYLQDLFSFQGLVFKEPLSQQVQHFVSLVFKMVTQNEQNAHHHRH